MTDSEGRTSQVLAPPFSGAGTNQPDGDQPYGGVVFDKLGNLYTTAIHGGATQYGAVIKLTP